MAEKKGNILPNNLEAEQSLLGCLFASLDARLEVFALVEAKDFYSLAHQKIYQSMLDCYVKDIAIDYVTVAKDLMAKGQLEEIGNMEYLIDLSEFMPSAANYKYYADIIRNDSILRQIIESSQQVINQAFNMTDAKDVLAIAEKNIFDISQSKSRSSLEHIKTGVADAIDLMEKLAIDPNANAGIKVGFPTLDKMTNGFKAGELIIIAARPGIGKTTLAVNFAINAALKYGKSIAMFDLEMSALQVAQRFICATGRIPSDIVKGGTKDPNTWASLFETKKLLDNANIYIDDTTTITPAEILSKCRKLKAQSGLDMVIVDYLQLMKAEKASKDGNRQQEVADLTRSIKLASRELGCPILLLSQLNRGVEQRSDKTPQLSDLRESGSIEQDADIVMFISDKPDENLKEEDMGDGVEVVDYTLVVAKHRSGSRGNIPIKWKPACTQFYEHGKDYLYTKNTSKVQKEAVLTPVSDSDMDDVFKD